MRHLTMKIGTPVNAPPDMSDPEQAEAVNSRMLPLSGYIDLSRRIIGKFAPVAYRVRMLANDDAIDYVAHEIMMGDWAYCREKSALSTYRGYRGKRAIHHYIDRVMGMSPTFELAECDEDGLSSSPLPTTPSVADQKDDIERRTGQNRLLRAVMSRLPDDKQACLIMHFVDGMSYSDIARAVGLTRESIRLKVDRSLELLRDQNG